MCITQSSCQGWHVAIAMYIIEPSPNEYMYANRIPQTGSAVINQKQRLKLFSHFIQHHYGMEEFQHIFLYFHLLYSHGKLEFINLFIRN